MGKTMSGQKAIRGDAQGGMVMKAAPVAAFVMRQAVPPPIVWTRFCNSGRLSYGIFLADFKG